MSPDHADNRSLFFPSAGTSNYSHREDWRLHRAGESLLFHIIPGTVACAHDTRAVIISQLDSIGETPVALRAAEFQGVWESEQRLRLYEDIEFSGIETFSSYSISGISSGPESKSNYRKPLVEYGQEDAYL
jgi:hypothetical protein